MNKNKENLKYFSICTVFLAVVIGSTVNARTFIEFKETPDVAISPEVLDLFVGNWQCKDGKELIQVVSVSPDGSAETMLSIPDPVSVRKASIDEIAGIIPVLVIDIEDEGRVVGQYNLILEDGTLTGTFEDIENGAFLDVSFQPGPERVLNS